MQLNYDCVRDTLLLLEDKLTISYGGGLSFGFIYLDDFADALDSYSPEDVYYAVFNLRQAGFISCFPHDEPEYVIDGIEYITFAGHEFLEEIRDAGKWTTINGILSKVRTFSLSAISAAAEGVTSALICKYTSGN